MKKVWYAISSICVAVIWLGFFLPWVSVDTARMGFITKAISGKELTNILISGIDVPFMANSNNAALLESVAKIFNPQISGIGVKSLLIFIVPLLPTLLFCMLIFLRRVRWLFIANAVLFLGAASFITYKLKTTQLDKLVIKVDILYGLWMIVLGYFIFGLASGLCALFFKK
ncbi:MAG: hypothetical protein PHP69_07010 [Candidatus Omnitrophica bacterium]|jgi:hypothetical protein|nr:hypothetical protein [Candidatus Omnitrophota bacterium]MDD5440683.1 hypothetical protein [Candidatus Omnitrophota bacterium]